MLAKASGWTPGPLRAAVAWWSLLLLLLLLCSPQSQAASKDKRFKHDVDEAEGESGERFQLHSEGTLAEIVELGDIPEFTVRVETGEGVGRGEERGEIERRETAGGGGGYC